MLRRYRGAGIDPLSEKILTYPVLHYQNGGLVIDTDAETTLEGVYACGEIAGGTHGRNRMMGNSPARVRRLRTEGRPGCRRESERMSTTIDTDLQHTVEDAAAHLYVWALKDIPQDLRDALAAARGCARPPSPASACSRRSTGTSTSPTARRTSSARTPASPSTTCRVGEHFPLHPTRIYEGLRDGTARATVEHPLRSNAVHTITRENTGPNIGYRLPIVHWEFIADWDGLDVKCVPKGSGSENMSFLKMCVPADGVKGIKQFVLESIVGAGGKPCPPGIVGVGIGGSADYAMYLAKEAIMRPIGTRNPDPLVAQLEDELYGLLNETGIGPMGLGGDVTVLQCHIEHADTHMTLNPVAVNYQCWAARRASRPHRRRRLRRLRPGVLEHGQPRSHVPDHRPAGDPQAARRRRGHRAGPHHRHPRPHADPDLRPGRRAADGPQGRVPAAHRAERAQGSTETAATRRSASARRRARAWCASPSRSAASTACARSAARAASPTRRSSRCTQLGMVYFAIVGGAAALETTQIEEIEDVQWEELMPECLWKFRVKDFGPLTVGIDAHGNSLYRDVQTRAKAKLEELYARL